MFLCKLGFIFQFMKSNLRALQCEKNRNCPITCSESLQCGVIQYAVEGLFADTMLQADIWIVMTSSYGVPFFNLYRTPKNFLHLTYT